VLDYRAANKLVSTYIDPLEEALTINADGLLHPSYTVLLTRTGRLSSNDPNIQNFPKRKHKELRRQIKARFGHVFLALDYGQLEARIIAMASRDRVFCKAIIDGFDVHSAWLDECLKIHPDYLEHLAVETNLVGGDPKKIRKAGRDIIKTDFVFASFFGSGAPSISARTKIPQEKVTELHRVFWNTYADAKNWIKDRRYEYATLGTSRTLTGRERFDVLMGNEPLNNPIQGTGADIVVESMNALALLSRKRDDPYLHPRINIHDDLIFELPDDEDRIAEYMDVILPEMVRVRHDFQIVPLMVEARIGDNWADLTEFTTYTGAYNR
jgi:DNA polymerase-1